jgi:methylenetetrahydrofolate--tRNA-(uracil-5-)-methyltransferase
MNQPILVIGGGLAGSEAAWQIAQHGFKVRLYEMRPVNPTGAHIGSDLAELVCSNSLGSNLPDRASGVLKNELRVMNSMLLEAAEATALPAGAALAVDRDAFARMVTERIESHPNIEIIREEMKEIPSAPVILASGPLTSDSLSKSIAQLSGDDHLFFFDAISPIVRMESINMDIAFRASRYGKHSNSSTADTTSTPQEDEGDYINCAFTKEQYYEFVNALKTAERIELRSFEEAILSGVKAGQFFEGCLPVEIIAERGEDSLAFWPHAPCWPARPANGQASVCGCATAAG